MLAGEDVLAGDEVLAGVEVVAGAEVLPGETSVLLSTTDEEDEGAAGQYLPTQMSYCATSAGLHVLPMQALTSSLSQSASLVALNLSKHSVQQVGSGGAVPVGTGAVPGAVPLGTGAVPLGTGAVPLGTTMLLDPEVVG